jgi:hypothetical protein
MTAEEKAELETLKTTFASKVTAAQSELDQVIEICTATKGQLAKLRHELDNVIFSLKSKS